jgi:Ca-activated chloride channel family protein
MGSIVWHNPWAFAFLAAAVPFLLFLMARERRRSAALRLPLAGLFRTGPRGLARLWWMPHLARLLAVVLATVALARPQMRGARARDLSVEGIDIVVALDISTSMDAADFRPKDRITVAKDVLRRFIESRTNDRIGLVVFAGEAYTQAPLTLDYHVLAEILGSVRTGLIEDGTAIGNALATAINRLRESDAKSKVVILITDGDNNAGNISPMSAAAIAKELGIGVYTIVVGKGGMVPYPSGKDFFGEQVFREVEIPVNPELLKSIAKETGGKSYNAIDRKTLESGLNDILDQLEKTKLYQSGGYQIMTEVYEPFLLAAALLALVGLGLSATRWRSFP